MVASPWLKIFCLAPPKSAAPAVLLIHDDSCHLFKHCLKRLPPPYPSRMSNHTDLFWPETCHPDLPGHAERLKEIRTSVCDFTFT